MDDGLQPIRALFDEVTEEQMPRLSRWFQPRRIRGLAREHDITGLRSSRLWPLLMLALWLRVNPDVDVDAGD